MAQIKESKMTEQEMGWFAAGLINEHLSPDWIFDINNKLTSSLGRCLYFHSDEVDDFDLPLQQIELAGRVAKQGSREMIEQTLRHEIAHAMDPMTGGHPKAFWDRVVELGGLDKEAEKQLLIDNEYVG